MVTAECADDADRTVWWRVVRYRAVVLPVHYRVDFLCFDSIIVELKASNHLTPLDEAQMINYLTVSGLRKGLLLNFGKQSLQVRRFVNSVLVDSARYPTESC